VDLETGILTVIAAKLGRSRLVPLDQTATAALRAYAERRDQHHPRPRSDTFFVTDYGTSLQYGKVNETFVKLRRQLGWTTGRGERPPRIHDMRHAFVVRRLLRWYEEGADIDRKIGSLSTYLGHVKVSNTYWYLTAVPELLAIGAARFEEFAGRDDAGPTP
jgi:integrase